MKKKYIIVPLVCVAVLVAIIVAVAVILNTGYLKKLSYDHMSSSVYNGVEVVGDDGLFYLVKDGKKVSKGYVSLQSVNDFYADSLLEAAQNGISTTLFDCYLARAEENSNYLLVNSQGEELTVIGESLSLDTDKTCLPYLVFTDNSNGRKAAISLHRLDSDLSYKSGNELTLRPFKDVTPGRASDDSVLCSYLVTDDVTDEPQTSYFGSDGIKISSGSEIYPIELYAKGTGNKHLYFHNTDDGKIFSVSGELIATNVVEIFRADSSDWRYAICPSGAGSRLVIFSPQRIISLSDSEYNLSTAWSTGRCAVLQRADASGIDVINVNTGRISTYISATPNGSVITATAKDGAYRYLDADGFEILTAGYGDMIPVRGLSDDTCTVFSSAIYDAESGSETYHFAAVGQDVYTLDVSELSVRKTQFDTDVSYPCFTVESTKDGDSVYTLLAPFAAAKNETEYNSVSAFSQNGVCWILGASYEKSAYDIIDPLTAKVITTFKCTSEDFAKYIFEHTDNIALATDKQDTDTAVHMVIVKLSKYDADDLMNSARYFVLYRPLPISFTEYGKTALNVMEIGSDLLLDGAINEYTDKNYLVTHTASGSTVYSLDDEGYLLAEVADLPYRVTGILTDAADISVDYFVVENDSGMMGLYNEDAEAVLSPYYSNIVHADNGFFVVALKGAYGVIRVSSTGPKTVIDFLYSSIVPLGDKGYLATNGDGSSEVYSGKKIVLAEPIQSLREIYSYRADEDGNLTVNRWTLISADASLYIHRSEQKLDLTFGNYLGCESATDGVLNQRATVIYYYTGTELIHTDVIYPNSSLLSLYDSPDNEGWFTSRLSSEQTVPIAAEDIINMGKNIIKLYSKTN